MVSFEHEVLLSLFQAWKPPTGAVRATVVVPVSGAVRAYRDTEEAHKLSSLTASELAGCLGIRERVLRFPRERDAGRRGQSPTPRPVLAFPL